MWLRFVTFLYVHGEFFVGSGNSEILQYGTSNVTARHRGPKWKLRAGYRAPSWHPRHMCRQSYFCLLEPSTAHVTFFHRRVWYCAFLWVNARYACIRQSGIILTPLATLVPNFVSVAPSTAVLSHGEKIVHSITHLAYLMCRGFGKTLFSLHLNFAIFLMLKICSILIWRIFQLILLCNLFHVSITKNTACTSWKCWYSTQINLWWWAVPKLRAYLILWFYSNRENLMLAKYMCFTVCKTARNVMTMLTLMYLQYTS